MPGLDDDINFRDLFAGYRDQSERAPSSPKARLYTYFVGKQRESGALASLDRSVASGQGICVFETMVQIAPVGEKAKSPFFCQTCHARVLAERLEGPPIFWLNCPYVKFKES